MIESSPYFHLFNDAKFNDTNIKELDVSKLSRGQWLVVRKSFCAIGGSDVGVIMNLNPYKDAIRLFYEKLGLYKSEMVENQFTFWGRVLEDPVIEVWKHWGGNMDSTYSNYDKGIKTREGRNRGMMWNPAFPYVVANIDHEITLHPDYNGSGIYEGKTISGYAQDKWESGLPVYYIPQPYTYMIATGSDYAEFGVLRDGRDFSVHTFDAKHNIINTIKNHIEEFAWRLQEGLKVMEKVKQRKEVLKELTEIEPEPTEKEDYGKFVSEKHAELDVKAVRGATEEEIELATRYKRLDEAFRNTKDERQYARNQLKRLLSRSYTRKITWDDGYVSFNKKFIVK